MRLKLCLMWIRDLGHWLLLSRVKKQNRVQIMVRANYQPDLHQVFQKWSSVDPWVKKKSDFFSFYSVVHVQVHFFFLKETRLWETQPGFLSDIKNKLRTSPGWISASPNFEENFWWFWQKFKKNFVIQNHFFKFIVIYYDKHDNSHTNINLKVFVLDKNNYDFEKF